MSDSTPKPPGFVYRRRYKRVDYPATLEAWTERGYNPQGWDEDFGTGAFFATVLANPNGLDEREEAKAGIAYAISPTDETREGYRRVIAGRIKDWNYSTENREGVIVEVDAPDADPDAWERLDLLPDLVAAWLTNEVVRAPFPPPLTPSPQPETTGDTAP